MTEFSSIEDIVEDLKQGKMIVLVDDEDRENEGDLVCAAEKTTPEIINFMATHGRGLICLPLALNQKMEVMPAGSGVVAALLIVFLVLVITDLVGLTDVFPFVSKQ